MLLNTEISREAPPLELMEGSLASFQQQEEGGEWPCTHSSVLTCTLSAVHSYTAFAIYPGQVDKSVAFRGSPKPWARSSVSTLSHNQKCSHKLSLSHLHTFNMVVPKQTWIGISLAVKEGGKRYLGRCCGGQGKRQPPHRALFSQVPLLETI